MKLPILVLFAHCAFAAVPSCPNGWSSFDGATKCYKLIRHPGYVNPTELFQSCLNNHAVPATIHNAFENHFFTTLEKPSNEVERHPRSSASREKYEGYFGLTWTVKNNFTNYDGTPVKYIGQWDTELSAPTSDSVMGLNPDGTWWYQTFDAGFGKPIFCQRDV